MLSNIKINNINININRNSLSFVNNNIRNISSINKNNFTLVKNTNIPKLQTRNIVSNVFNTSNNIVTLDWIWESYIIGKGIVLFVMFYTVINWMFYMREREILEKKTKK